MAYKYASQIRRTNNISFVSALILENERIPPEEINNVLDMTAEFSRYMQQGVPVVNHFLDEYLYFNTGEYQSKLLALIQWITSISISGISLLIFYIPTLFIDFYVIVTCAQKK